MNYEAERAMNQKRLRMEGEPGHGVVQGNGLPLNYMDNGHQIPYQPYAGAYNTHYPPPDAFAAYGPPPPGGYAPQNLSYAPPAHQNYPHHQAFPPQQPPQAQLHMPQSHMLQGYGDVGMHKAAWAPQPHLLPPLDPQKALDAKHKPEIKLEPTDPQKRVHPESDMMSGDLEQPKIKIKTDIFKPDDPHAPQRHENDKPLDVPHKPIELAQPPLENKEVPKTEEKVQDPTRPTDPNVPQAEKIDNEIKRESFSSPERSSSGSTPGKTGMSGLEPKKRGRPKGSTNKPKALASPGVVPSAAAAAGGPRAPAPSPARPQPARPRAPGYQYAIRPFRKDFSGIQFRRRWSDDCLDSSHIPNEVYFGDVPVSTEILFNYYDANAEREKLAAQAAQIAAQKAAAAKMAAAKMAARGTVPGEVTTVDSSSEEDSSGSSGSDSSDEDDAPLKRGPGRPKGTSSSREKTTSTSGTPGRRGRPPVPPELRPPGVTDMKRFCAAAGLRLDYKKLVEGCTKNKERVAKMMELLVNAGLEGKPTLEKCKALKAARISKKDEEKKAKKQAKAKKEEVEGDEAEEAATAVPRRMTRGQTGVKPRQKIVISSDEEEGTPSACRNISKLRSMLDDTDSD